MKVTIGLRTPFKQSPQHHRSKNLQCRIKPQRRQYAKGFIRDVATGEPNQLWRRSQSADKFNNLRRESDHFSSLRGVVQARTDVC